MKSYLGFRIVEFSWIYCFWSVLVSECISNIVLYLDLNLLISTAQFWCSITIQDIQSLVLTLYLLLLYKCLIHIHNSIICWHLLQLVVLFFLELWLPFFSQLKNKIMYVIRINILLSIKINYNKKKLFCKLKNKTCAT